MKDTRQRLLEAATRIFAREGVSGATTREIARAAEVNEVTLFRHFQNKEELLRQVVLQYSKNFENVFASATFENQAEIRRTVQTFVLSYAKMLLKKEEFIRTFFAEMKRHETLCRQLFVESSQSVRNKFITYLATAQKNRLIRADVDVTTAADALSGMLLIGVMRRPLTKSVYSYDRYVRTCLELFLKGIEP
jgi:AcrR family transcriptional regulator